MSANFRISIMKQATPILAFLCLTLSFVLISSSNVRASVVDSIKIVGGFTFSQLGQIPETDNEHAGEAQRAPIEQVAIADANEKLPFNVVLPRWTPDGFVLEKTADKLYRSISFNWQNDQGQNISLYIHPHQQDALIPIGENGVEEIKINGHPAALINGIWSNTTSHGFHWDSQPHNHWLRWHQGDLTYNLAGEKGVSIDDLVRMAESVQ